MTIYQIDEAILGCIDPETGEVDAEKLGELTLQREQKVENIACWIKNLVSDAKALKDEKKALEERIKAKENRAESLKAFLESVLDGQRFETSKCAVSFRKTQSVNISDLSAIPADYLRFKPAEADKTAIKAAIKNGETVSGAELIEKLSMSIK